VYSILFITRQTVFPISYVIVVDHLFLVWECSTCTQSEPHSKIYYDIQVGALKYLCYIQIEVDMAINVA